jgi:hypothetical protein
MQGSPDREARDTELHSNNMNREDVFSLSSSWKFCHLHREGKEEVLLLGLIMKAHQALVSHSAFSHVKKDSDEPNNLQCSRPTTFLAYLKGWDKKTPFKRYRIFPASVNY